MTQYFAILHSVPLFRGIAADDLSAMLGCLNAEIASYAKGEILLLAGEKPTHVGVVLSGSLQIVKEDYVGTRTLVAHLQPGDFFAEALCCAKVPEIPVTVVADAKAVVMRLDFTRILQTCSSACTFHHRLIANMLEVIARKNLFLQSCMEIMRLKSVRAKVLGYLTAFPAKQNGYITIPLSREEMADYLCVDRSALSHELMKMKRDCLLDYHKNTFALY